jgi:mannosyltransferase
VSKSQLARALPIAILFGGFALRLYRLGAESLWYDETVSLLLARNDLAELTRHTAGDIHPPFYYYLLHFWGQFAGWSEFASAFLSLFFGVLLIALAYRVAREWFTRSPKSSSLPIRDGGSGVGIPLIACFLVAVSPYNVWYSQEVRMYTIGATLGLLSVYFLLRMLSARKVISGDFLMYVIVTTLGLYTLYYFIFLVVFEYLLLGVRILVSFFTRHPSSSSHLGAALATFIPSQFAVALLYLPWLPIAFRQATDPPVPPWRTFMPLREMLVETYSALVLGQSVEPLTVAPFLILILGLVAYSLIRRRSEFGSWKLEVGVWKLRLVALFLLAYTFVPLLAIYLFSLWKPLYHVRYIFTYSPAFYILLALAIHVAARQLARQNVRGLTLFVGAALTGYALASAYALGNFWFDPHYADDDLRGAVQQLAENWRPGDVILVNAGYAYPALLYYYPTPVGPRVRLANYQPAPDDAKTAPVVLMTGSIGGSARLGWGDPLSDFYPTSAEETRAALARVFQSHPRVWVLRIYDTVADPDGVIRAYFTEQARLIDDQGFTGESNARVQGFLTQSLTALPAEATALNARLADRVTLLGFERVPVPAHAGDSYDAALYWQPLWTLNLNYQLSLQILDAQGSVIAQHDETPLGNALPTSRWRPGEIYREPVRLQLPQDVAPGEYAVIVKLYNLNTGEVFGDPIRLESLSVRP